MMNESKELKRAAEMARESIYDAARLLGRWKSYDVYEPTFDDDEPRCVGFPQFILARGGALRWTADSSESRAIMAEFFSDEEEEEDDN